MPTDDKNENKVRELEKRYLTAIALIALVAVISTYMCFHFYQGSNRMHTEITERINQLNEYQAMLKKDQVELRDQLSGTPSSGKAASTIDEVIPATDMQIEFFKNQMASHQAFIEREREFLVKMLGVILAGGGALQAFFGWKRKSDILETVNLEYKTEANARMKAIIESSFREQLIIHLSNDENLAKLVTSLVKKDQKKEQTAKSKKLLFIRQENSDILAESIKKYRQAFQDSKHGGSVLDIKYRSELLTTKPNERPELEEADIVVFEVSEAEKQGSAPIHETFAYAKIAEYCATFNPPKTCILFCNGGFFIERELIGGATPSGFIPKLEENIDKSLND